MRMQGANEAPVKRPKLAELGQGPTKTPHFPRIQPNRNKLKQPNTLDIPGIRERRPVFAGQKIGFESLTRHHQSEQSQ